MVERIEALGAPEGDEDEINGIIADTREILDDVSADPSTVVKDPFADVNSRLDAYGLTECAG